MFVGQNCIPDVADVPALSGRPEHTDSIGMGTWHVQLAGTKVLQR